MSVQAIAKRSPSDPKRQAIASECPCCNEPPWRAYVHNVLVPTRLDGGTLGVL